MVADYKWVCRRQHQIPMDDMDWQEILFNAILYDEWCQQAPARAAQAAQEEEEAVMALRLVARFGRST